MLNSHHPPPRVTRTVWKNVLKYGDLWGTERPASPCISPPRRGEHSGFGARKRTTNVTPGTTSARFPACRQGATERPLARGQGTNPPSSQADANGRPREGLGTAQGTVGTVSPATGTGQTGNIGDGSFFSFVSSGRIGLGFRLRTVKSQETVNTQGQELGRADLAGLRQGGRDVDAVGAQRGARGCPEADGEPHGRVSCKPVQGDASKGASARNPQENLLRETRPQPLGTQLAKERRVGAQSRCSPRRPARCTQRPQRSVRHVQKH